MTFKKTFWMNVFLFVFWTLVGFYRVADDLIIHAPIKRALILTAVFSLIMITSFMSALSIKFYSVTLIKKLALFCNYSVLVFLLAYLLIVITGYLYASWFLFSVILLTTIINLRAIKVLDKASLIKRKNAS